MKFEIYCDESRPELFSSKNPKARYMVIGSVWLKAEDRADFKKTIRELSDKHRVGGEFKWQKISKSREGFYRDLVGWFFGVGDRLRYRCIAVDREKVDLLRYHENDQELGFYKFYYQMLHHWILDFNEYAVFCDFKRNRVRSRLHTLQRCLGYSNLSSQITNVQALPSHESVLIQLADVITGAVSARLNNTARPGSSKEEVITELERNLGHKIQHTVRGERKFNVFVIDLQGGW